MAGSMSREDLVADLRDSLHDAATIFTEPANQDFDRLLALAAQDMGRHQVRNVEGALTLVAGKAEYFAPSDIIAFVCDHWGEGRRPQAWEINYPGPNPRVKLIESSGVLSLLFSPAPSGLQIALYGSAYNFEYLATHIIDDDADKTTVPAGARGLLILRAQAEAMREVAIRNSAKPVQMRDGMTGMSRVGSPAALYQALLKEYREALS